MGAMLKYGSEGAKQFNLMFMIKPEHAEAHRRRRHPHPRHGFPDADDHLLPDRPDQAVQRRILHRPRLPARAEGHPFSYAALACIAIQANQNDQHGGQSIVNFDYAMADGVRKTFCKTLPRTT